MATQERKFTGSQQKRGAVSEVRSRTRPPEASKKTEKGKEQWNERCLYVVTGIASRVERRPKNGAKKHILGQASR